MITKIFAKKWEILKKTLLGAGMFLLMSTVVSAASLSLSPASKEFVTGCESAINIIVDTEGVDSNGADVFINFDPSEVEIVDKDASIPGIQIQGGNIYELYFGDVDTGTGLIRSSAVSMFGQYNGSNGVYGTLVFKGKPGVTSTTFTFDFTPGESTDSNVAEYPSSDDILTSVSGGTYTFRTGFCGTDAIPPVVSNEQPANGSQGNPLDSNITFDITDNLSGVDIDTVEVRIDGTPYENGDAGFSYTGVPLDYDITIDPSSDFQQDIPVFVEIDARDISGNVMPTYTFSFNHPVLDLEPPYVRNPNPAPGSQGVPLDANITFNLKDDLSGVDLDTVVVNVHGTDYVPTDPNFSFTGNSNDYFIAIDPVDDFPDNTQITVEIDADDQAGNTMPTYRYTFNQTVTDNTPPNVRNPQPAPNSRQVPVNTNLEFDIRDNFSGVDIDTVVVRVDGEVYRNTDGEFVFSGDKMLYHIIIDPRQDFPEEEEITVKIDAIDLAGNVMTTYIYRFNRPAVCGDNLVELDFGEECEPPGTACCDSECKVVETVEELIEQECPIVEPEEVVVEVPVEPEIEEREPYCGNGIIDENEQCEPPDGTHCDDVCRWIDVEPVVQVIDEEEAERTFVVQTMDTDGDGVSDMEEILDYGTDPEVPDEFVVRTKITNWKDGDRTGSGRLFVKGTSHQFKKVQVYAIDQFKEEFYLGESSVDEEYKWAFLSDVELEEGVYLLRAEAYELNGDYIDESVTVKVIIDYDDYLPAPTVESISDQPVLEDVRIEIFENQPVVFGRTEPDAQVFATFESTMVSSTILSDSQFGFFTIYAPRPLEVGDHTVTLYAVNTDGIRSDVEIVEFDIVILVPWYLKWWWLWLLLLLLLLLLIYLGYRYYKKKKKEKEMRDFEIDKDEELKEKLEMDTGKKMVHGIGEGRVWELQGKKKGEGGEAKEGEAKGGEKEKGEGPENKK